MHLVYTYIFVFYPVFSIEKFLMPYSIVAVVLFKFLYVKCADANSMSNATDEVQCSTDGGDTTNARRRCGPQCDNNNNDRRKTRQPGVSVGDSDRLKLTFVNTTTIDFDKCSNRPLDHAVLTVPVILITRSNRIVVSSITLIVFFFFFFKPLVFSPIETVTTRPTYTYQLLHVTTRYVGCHVVSSNSTYDQRV